MHCHKWLDCSAGN